MEVTGKVRDISKDYIHDKFLLTLEINEAGKLLLGADEVKDVEKLDIKLTKWHKKRSLDANGYLWVLLSEIAAMMKASKEEIYELMLTRYGTYYKDDNGYIVITVKSNVDMDNVPGHWHKYKSNDDWSSYLMIKGSSEYNTAEMSKLIDGVVSEAKEMGIDTITPAELERMKQTWKA